MLQEVRGLKNDPNFKQIDEEESDEPSNISDNSDSRLDQSMIEISNQLNPSNSKSKLLIEEHSSKTLIAQMTPAFVISGPKEPIDDKPYS